MPPLCFVQRTLGSWLATVACIATHVSAAAQVPSLSESVQRSLTHSASVQTAKLGEEVAQARADQARAALLPSLAAQLRSTHSDGHMRGLVPAAQRDLQWTEHQATLEATLPLLRPVQRAASAQAQHGVALAQAQHAWSRQQRIVQTAQVYFSWQLAAHALRLHTQQQRLLQHQTQRAQHHFAQGITTIVDLREAQARADAIAAQVTAAQAELDTQRLNLEHLTGQSLPSLQAAASSAPLPLEAHTQDWPQALLNTAAAQQPPSPSHPMLSQARIHNDIASLAVQKAASAHAPQVEIQARYSHQHTPQGSPSAPLLTHANVASVGIVVNVPLFAGFALNSAERQAAAEAAQAALQLDDAQRHIHTQWSNAAAGLRAAAAHLKALHTAVDSAELAWRASERAHALGLREQLDAWGAQTHYFEALHNAARAHYQFLNAYLALELAAGTVDMDDVHQLEKIPAPTDIAIADFSK